jgi:hypothetical protein
MPKLTQEQMGKLIKHSKMHKGGMQSKHMKNMIKFMKEGDSFSVAHNKAKKLDNEKKPMVRTKSSNAKPKAKTMPSKRPMRKTY